MPRPDQTTRMTKDTLSDHDPLSRPAENTTPLAAVDHGPDFNRPIRILILILDQMIDGTGQGFDRVAPRSNPDLGWTERRWSRLTSSHSSRIRTSGSPEGSSIATTASPQGWTRMRTRVDTPRSATPDRPAQGSPIERCARSGAPTGIAGSRVGDETTRIGRVNEDGSRPEPVPVSTLPLLFTLLVSRCRRARRARILACRAHRPLAPPAYGAGSATDSNGLESLWEAWVICVPFDLRSCSTMELSFPHL
mgnify:CR=1 FL=1